MTTHHVNMAAPSSSTTLTPPTMPSLLAAQESIQLLSFALDMYSRHQDGVMMLMEAEEGGVRLSDLELKLMCHRLRDAHRALWREDMAIGDEEAPSSSSSSFSSGEEEGEVSVVKRGSMMMLG